MENISNQLSYLKGLIDGLKIDPESDYGAVFEGIVNVLDEMNNSIDELAMLQDELTDQVELIDEDLAAIEDEFEEEYDDDDEEDFEYYEIDCPKCGATVCLDEDFFDTDSPVTCPECGEEFDITIECDGNCDGCTDCDE